MKAFPIVLILGFAWQSSTYAETRHEKMATCIRETQYKYKISEMDLSEAVMWIGNPEWTNKLKNVSQEMMAGLFACFHQRLYPKENLNDHLKSLIRIDDEVSEEERQRMLQTLSTCNKNATGNNTKLLSCINVFDSSFGYLMYIIRVVHADDYWCYFSKCGLTIGKCHGQMNKVRQAQDYRIELTLLPRFSEIIGEKKWLCFVACRVDTLASHIYSLRNKNESEYVEVFSNKITRSTQYSKNEKKEMLETLNMCKQQAIGDDKTEKLFKCVNILKPPFVHFA